MTTLRKKNSSFFIDRLVIALIILAQVGCQSQPLPQPTGKTTDPPPQEDMIQPSSSLTSVIKSSTDTPSPMTIDPTFTLISNTTHILNELGLADGFGIQILDPAHLTHGAQLLNEAGVKWVNLGIEWRQLAPDISTRIEDYGWEPFDNMMDTARRQGFNVMVTLGGNPCWAATYDRGPVDRVEISRFTEYVQSVVERYHNIVRLWAIYNEPDAISAIRTKPDCIDPAGTQANVFGDHPQEYVDTLRIAYNTIKSIDPSAIVLLGGIAYDNFTTEGGPFNPRFLADILDNGAGDYFDVMNFHYYSEYDWRWGDIAGKAQAIQHTLQEYGFVKPIICSELGISSSPIYGLSNEKQSQGVIKFYTRAFAADIKIGIWYNMNDYNSATDPFRFHGLLDVYFAPKPSLKAYQTITSQLQNHIFMRRLSPDWGGANNLEGYIFRSISEGKETIIVWSNDNVDQNLRLPTNVISVRDKYGNHKPYITELIINEDPLFITLTIES